MRSHGVPSFPDPGTRVFKNAFQSGSPAFKSAYPGCEHLEPGGGPPNQTHVPSHAQTVALLGFASCMRHHGFGQFPDPDNTGQITHQMVANAGINLHQPAALRVADACVSVTHRQISKADVARFIAGQ